MNIQNSISNYLKKNDYKSLNIKAVFFDMDGILFNSMPFHAWAWCKTFESEGVTFSEYQAYMNEGRTGASTINEVFLEQKGRIATDLEIQNIYKKKSSFFDSCGKAKPIDDIHAILNQLKKDGKDIFVVTGSGQESLLNNLNQHFPNIFCKEKMVTAYDVKYGKPNPEPYLIALKKSHCLPNEVCVVENAPLGVQAGHAAGLFTIAVNTGILKDEDLLSQGADILFHNMKEFYEHYNQIF
ncbi:MAG: HAD-IA family hydrolase [Paludibacteraceae bacterium]|nr:HAD-IA family hydrolase [Paludibacteraceae bacterium]